MPPQTPVGLIGVGLMGEVYAVRLLAAGFGVIGFDVDPARMKRLAQIGARAGSLDEIARAKGELFAGLAPGGVAVLPDDDERLAAQAAGAAHKLRFGESERAEVRLAACQPAGAAGSDVVIDLQGARISFRLPLPGRHNARNAAAAAAAAHALGRTPDQIAAGLAAARPAHHRSEIVPIGGRNVLADLYNANPSSERAALDTLVELRGEKRAVAILGDMLELGPDEVRLHCELGEYVAARGVDGLVGVGKLGREIVRGATDAGMPLDRVFITTEKMPAAVRAVEWTGPGDWLLVKGSRSMHMEDVLDALKDELE